jgi:TonB-linked SusC/RagA family outer membrane protein
MYLTKMLRVMKLTAIILFTISLHVAANGTAQKVSLSVKGGSLKTVFIELNRQTGYNFLYSDAVLAKAVPVTIKVKDLPLADVLVLCFKDQPLDYTMDDNAIVVMPKPEPVPVPGTLPVIPPIDISGRVINENGEPVVATVVIKGTGNGTTTNSDGYFELKKVNENATLVISGVSIETREIKVAGKTSLSITVKISADEGKAVTVSTGYWTTGVRASTGNISRVDAKEIAKQPVSDPLQAIQGRMPGVFIQQTSGVPGGKINIQIRGKNSLRYDANDPLFIIDGVPYTSKSLSNGNVSSTISLQGMSPLNAINPNDIESIEVLKDADATAIYGSRGSNGVVLITTKKGKAGKTRVDINVYNGEGKVGDKMKLLNTQQYLEMRREAFKNDNRTITATNAFDLLVLDTTRYTDWQKVLIGGTARTTSANISLSGGTANTQYLVNAGYYKQGSVFPGSFNYQKGSAHFNLTHLSENKRFKASVLMSYMVDKNRLPKYDLTENALSLLPHAPALYDANGNLNWTNFAGNPLAYTKAKFDGRTNNVVANTSLEYIIVPGLAVKTNISYTHALYKEYQTNPISANSPVFGYTEGAAVYGNNTISTWNIEPQVTYTTKIAKGNLSVLAGTSFLQTLQDWQAIYASGFTNDELLENIKFATSIDVYDYNNTQYRYHAVFGRINYNWQERYIVNLTGRRDGSSRFGPNKRFANFGAVGAAWIFSNEPFFKLYPVISFGKIRASYGSAGSDNIGDYQYLDTYMASSYPYNDVAGLYPGRLVNADYSWEVNRKLEAALELGFLQDRLMLNISWYRNRCSNQLIGYPLSVVTGFPSIQSNFPATVQNTGLELELNTDVIKRRAFSWSMAINASFPRTKLVAFPNIEKYPAYANQYEIGYPLVSRKLILLGVDPLSGLYTFADLNGNGNSTDYPGDYQMPRKSGVDYYGGWNNRITYRSFQLSFLVQFTKQTGGNYLNYFSMPGSSSNQPVEVMRRWRKPGDVTDIQKFSTTGAASNAYSYAAYSSIKTTSDASFARLQNVYLSWALPAPWLNAIRSSSARLYVEAQNLFTISRYRGLSTETLYRNLPPLRVIVAGFQLTL